MPLYPPQSVRATASVTIQWNTAAKPVPAAPRSATVMAVSGTRVTVRFADGSTQHYVASAQEASALQHLIGKTIAFRIDR